MKRIMKRINQDTIESKFNEFLEEKIISGLRPKTISTYRNHFHAIGIDPDTPADLIDWSDIVLRIREKDVTESTINSYLRTLKVFMSWLGEKNLPKLRKVETTKELYTDEELKILLKKPAGNCSFAEYRSWCIVMLVLDTGLRSSSIRNIKIKDVDISQKIITVRHTKTHKLQVLPFSDASRNAINSYLKHRTGEEDDYLFCTVYGTKLSENGLATSIEFYNRSRGIEKTSLHLLRHCFSRIWVTSGADPFSLQMMLGHSDLTQTKHYCQLYSNDLIKKYISPVEQLRRIQIKKQK